MILKLLLIIAVISAVYFLFFKKKPLQSTKESEKKNLKADDMVECASCGIYASVDDSILSNGKYFCSAECLKKGV